MNLRPGRATCVCLAALAIGLLASGCDWNQLGFSSGHSGDNAGETSITPTDVSTLTEQFSASDGTGDNATPEAVVNGVLYASDARGVEAYSAKGTTGCSGSPTTCSPMWSYATGAIGNDVPAVLNGVVYVSSSSQLEAFDASGKTNCSGSPSVCQPLWTAAGVFGSPTISGGTAFVTTSHALEAFDAAGQTNCSGTPKVCGPMWTSPVADPSPVATASAGIAYVISDDGVAGSTIVALDATGSRNCSGSPKVCTPLWTYRPTYDRITDAYPVVSGSTLYVDTDVSTTEPPSIVGDLEAFDATGVDGCSGTPAVCSPTGSSPNNSPSLESPVVGDGAAFEPLGLGPAYGFAAYSSNILGGASSLWESSVGAYPEALGGSVLLAGNGTTIYAFDAGGSTSCSGSICSPLWSASGTAAIIANGNAYLGTASSGIVAYGLPS
jgi:hypothetical protein